MAAIRQSRPARAVPATPYPPEWSIPLTPHGASGTPPPTNNGTHYCRGEHCSPVNLEVRQTAAGAHCAPLHPLFLIENLGPEGINMEKNPKALRKMQSFLHFLAFGFFDHNFGVLRGERLAAKTMAASLLRKPARAVIRPSGANIARSSVSPRSTVAPCSQPRNPLRRAAVRLRSNQSPVGALKHTSEPALRDGGARCAPPSARFRK